MVPNVLKQEGQNTLMFGLVEKGDQSLFKWSLCDIATDGEKKSDAIFSFLSSYS